MKDLASAYMARKYAKGGIPTRLGSTKALAVSLGRKKFGVRRMASGGLTDDSDVDSILGGGNGFDDFYRDFHTDMDSGMGNDTSGGVGDEDVTPSSASVSDEEDQPDEESGSTDSDSDSGDEGQSYAKGGMVRCAHGGPATCAFGCYAEGGQSNPKLREAHKMAQGGMVEDTWSDWGDGSDYDSDIEANEPSPYQLDNEESPEESDLEGEGNGTKRLLGKVLERIRRKNMGGGF